MFCTSFLDFFNRQPRLAMRLSFPLIALLLVSATTVPLTAQLAWFDLTYDDTAQTLNPYKGFMDYSPGETPGAAGSPQHSLEFFYIGMDEFYDVAAPQPIALAGADFGSLEAELNGIQSRGRQAVFRIFIDFPIPLGDGEECPTYSSSAEREQAARAAENFALPSFLYSELDLGDYCLAGDSYGFQPDYTDNDLLTEIEDLMAAIDAQYDSQPLSPMQNDPRIAFIEVGFLGHWGEWHTFLDPTNSLDCGVGDFLVHDAMNRVLDVMDATEGAFGNTRVAVSADVLQCQLHFDGSGASTPGISFLRSVGIHDDDFANSTVCDTSDGYLARSQFHGLDNDWRSLTIGGEVQPSLQAQIHANDDGLDCMVDPDESDTGELDGAVAAVHASWLLNYNLFQPPDGSTPPMQYVNAEETTRRMGYQIHVAEVALPETVGPNDQLDLVLRMENRGLAPIAYNLPVDLVVLEGATEVATFPLESDVVLRDVIDLTQVDFNVQVASHGLAGGTYDLGLRVPSPMVGGLAVQFANAEQVGDVLMLGSVEVLGTSIFFDGFESGSTAEWSASLP